jgi:hypothetical protein
MACLGVARQLGTCFKNKRVGVARWLRAVSMNVYVWLDSYLLWILMCRCGWTATCCKYECVGVARWLPAVSMNVQVWLDSYLL